MSKYPVPILTNARFELAERRCFQGEYSWRLKEGELRYRGTKHFQSLFNGRIPVTEEMLQKFIAALDLVEVWDWRGDYSPGDIELAVLDGGDWLFKAEIDGRSVKASGDNAYPAYENAQQTTCEEQRFRLLKAALYDAFSIDVYIGAFQRQAELASKIQEQGKIADQDGGSRI
jgi:hypothetical protein